MRHRYWPLAILMMPIALRGCGGSYSNAAEFWGEHFRFWTNLACVADPRERGAPRAIAVGSDVSMRLTGWKEVVDASCWWTEHEYHSQAPAAVASVQSDIIEVFECEADHMEWRASAPGSVSIVWSRGAEAQIADPLHFELDSAVAWRLVDPLSYLVDKAEDPAVASLVEQRGNSPFPGIEDEVVLSRGETHAFWFEITSERGDYLAFSEDLLEVTASDGVEVEVDGTLMHLRATSAGTIDMAFNGNNLGTLYVDVADPEDVVAVDWWILGSFASPDWVWCRRPHVVIAIPRDADGRYVRQVPMELRLQGFVGDSIESKFADTEVGRTGVRVVKPGARTSARTSVGVNISGTPYTYYVAWPDDLPLCDIEVEYLYLGRPRCSYHAPSEEPRKTNRECEIEGAPIVYEARPGACSVMMGGAGRGTGLLAGVLLLLVLRRRPKGD